MNRVIILGNDHTNSLGLVQTLGKSGFQVYAYVWGTKTGFVASSKYATKVIGAQSIQGCIDLMLHEFAESDNIIPIIACCDSAALALEKNKEKLADKFIFEHSTEYSLEFLFKKENQVRLATESGFFVPKTWNLSDSKNVPKDVVYPCLIKPLVSCEGAKTDIHVCRNEDELRKNLDNLKYTTMVLLQQYIERDYEISILGCGLKKGTCLIPAVENKLTLYPKYVGLECVANMQPLIDKHIISSIQNLIKAIGYVGVFSVEMMHCKHDNKFYFTEINLRNDGANSFVYKYGVNLPLNHIEDLLGKPLTSFSEYHSGFYIWDMHHFLSLIHREIRLKDWFSELRKSQGFLTYFSDDKKPFFRQYTNWIFSKLHLRKNEQY
ncbi:MAG: ATP-grasp domain-containing protein [Candidatus Aphodosoma sp.]